MIFWTLAVGFFFLILWLMKVNKEYHVMSLFSKRGRTTDGTPLEEIAPIPKGKTIFGNTFDVFGLDNVGLFQSSRILAKELKKSYIEYTMGIMLYNVIRADDAECIMSDTNLSTKGIVYVFLEPFLRTGLLTSSNKKWYSRRKLLTPAFHFNILEQFEEVFKEESRKFIEALDTNKSDVISLSKLIPKFTHNSVCETALGVQLDDRLDSDDYRQSFKMIEECFVKRISNAFYINDKVFNFFEGYKYTSDLKAVHEFSSGIIEKRRKVFAEESKQTTYEDTTDDISIGKKKRYAMLDTLLHAEKAGLIDHIGICEEVDTFMFEGFDTTSMGLIFGLMNLSLYPELQERCYQEINECIDDDLTKLDSSQLNNLRYLDCFIKESLRLYPPVPVIMRKAMNETTLANKLILPAETQIIIHIFDIHRDPKHFPNPDVFDPERFTPENSAGRHPYAYIPFSAGQRNCIGQKFAMLEMKTLLVNIIKNYKLFPMVDPKEFAFESGIIIRSQQDIKVRLEKRIKNVF